MNIVVFSKDRAMQLDLFIRSFNRYVKDGALYALNILYNYSNQEFKAGYERLIGNCPENIKFLEEVSFKADLVSLINPNYPYTVFFVDDDVFKEAFDFYDNQMDVFNKNTNIACRALNLHKNLNHCYTLNIPMPKPQFGDDNVFVWSGLKGDYGYPMSLDGHIFRTNDIMPYIIKINYNGPNILEGLMAKNPLNKPLMICYDRAIIVNNPINMVQAVSRNRHGNITAKFLNDKFLAGRMIKLDNFIGLDNRSCHQETQIDFV